MNTRRVKFFFLSFFFFLKAESASLRSGCVRQADKDDFRRKIKDDEKEKHVKIRRTLLSENRLLDRKLMESEFSDQTVVPAKFCFISHKEQKEDISLENSLCHSPVLVSLSFASNSNEKKYEIVMYMG
ncbi:hypothetical protein CEXT_160681 [Caerostris extrusa]|uniref:Uncharacterized protein n=1 Tax=Caerostris extrusa TaxID=172846 RepID=A0AAV4M7W2_CAEEX|nr:hypothetical protein CEXT_160681 [Caerostris extrusa]